MPNAITGTSSLLYSIIKLILKQVIGSDQIIGKEIKFCLSIKKLKGHIAKADHIYKGVTYPVYVFGNLCCLTKSQK